MKKILIAAIAATVMASPLAIATAEAAPQRDHRGQNDQRFDGRGRAAPAPNYRRWAKGQRFDRRYAQNYRDVPNWQQYRNRRLYQPPRGYHWVRSGNDAVLVAVAGGVIGAVLAGAFN